MAYRADARTVIPVGTPHVARDWAERDLASRDDPRFFLAFRDLPEWRALADAATVDPTLFEAAAS